MGQGCQGKGKIVDEPAQLFASVRLQIVEPVDGNPRNRFRHGNRAALVVFPGIAADRVYTITGGSQGFGGVKGKLGGGDIFGMKELTQKNNVLFLLQGASLLSLADWEGVGFYRDIFTLSGKEAMR